MATESNTFSALVDDVRIRSGRVDRTADINAYARSTIRECTVLAEFDRNTIEGTVAATAIPFVFTQPANFRTWEAIKYPYFDNHGNPIFAVEKRPGVQQNSRNPYWFYRAGNSHVFNGINAINDILTYAYQAYLPKLANFPVVADRPATYDIDTGLWTYHADYTGNATLNQQAQDLVTNWLLFDWYDLIVEGTLNKIYKTVGDVRAGPAFSLYKAQQKDLIAGEAKTILYQGETY